MTLLDDRPAAAAEPSSPPGQAGRGPASTWRFAARLARRETARRPGRTALAALLIAVPVAAMTAGSLLARTNASDWRADFERDYGAADIVATGPVGDVLDALPAGASVIGSWIRVSSTITPAGGRPGDATWVEFAVVDFANPTQTSGIEITAGRAPRTGEILLAPAVAQRLGVDVGDTLALDRPSGTWEVAGLGRLRGNYWIDLVAVPGFDPERIDASRRTETVLIAMPPGTAPGEIARVADDVGGFTRFSPWHAPSDLAAGMAWGYVAGVLALVAVGIVVAAAFATSARRQLVTIGQLAANGAPERIVRRTLFLQGSWTGAIGAGVGIAAGFACLPFVVPLVEQHLLYHELRTLRVSVPDLVVIAVTAVAAATMAAAVPARSASRVPLMAALAGRHPAGNPPPWLVPTGVALFAGGLGLVAVAALGGQGANASDHTWAALAVIGATAMVFGVCCASPLVVARLGRLGRRSSLAWRMALRSLGRSRTRSAAVVAAIAVTVGGAVAVAAVAELAIRSDAQCCPASIPADTVVVHTYVDVWMSSWERSWDETQEPVLVDLDPVVAFDPPEPVRQLLADGRTVPVVAATFDPAPFDPFVDHVDPVGPWIATPELLDLMRVSPANREILAEWGSLQVYFDRYSMTEAGETVAGPWAIDYRTETGTITVEAPPPVEPIRYPFDVQLLMTESAALAAGFDITEVGAIVRFGEPLSQSEIQRLRAIDNLLHGGWSDAFVEPGDAPPSNAVSGVSLRYDDPSWRAGDAELWLARLVVVAAALLLSLLVVSIGLALAAVEGRDERDVLVIVGATPSALRRLTAARAAVTAQAGIVLGIPLGFLPVWVVDRVTDDPYAFDEAAVRFPWLVVVALMTVIPGIVAAGAWTASGLATRFRPPSPTRRD